MITSFLIKCILKPMENETKSPTTIHKMTQNWLVERIEDVEAKRNASLLLVLVLQVLVVTAVEEERR